MTAALNLQLVTYQTSAKSRWGIIIGLVILLCLPLMLGYLLWHVSRQSSDSYAWVEHTHSVAAKLDNLRRLAREAESAQRGYILTKHERFAEEYKGIPPKAGAMLTDLEHEVSDNPSQQQRLKEVAQTMDERLRLLEKNMRDIDFYESLSQEQILTRITTSADKSAELERGIQEMLRAEAELLGQRRENFVSNLHYVQRLAASATSMGMLLFAGLGYLVFREQKSRGQYEARLADARDAALDAVRTTSAFVASVSHEIRTPMNGVLGTADLLLRDTALSPKQRDGLETIRTSGRSLLTIINDILDLSKLQAGEMVFVRENFAPSQVVEEVIALFAAAASRKGLELAAHLAPDLPQHLLGDHQRLRQVLVNLVSNAVKFTERGGVTVHLVRRREAEDGGRICLRFDVSDTGPGIAREVQGRLFQPFAQVDTKLAQRHGGTGLGLAVSRELVQHMNGAMGVESNLGHGATFWFTAIFDATRDSESARALEPRPLMVVESRPMTAEAVRAHAAAWGLQPMVFAQESDVPQQEPAPQQQLASAIVIGSHATQDWLESVRRLRERSWLKQVPIFLMTEHENLSGDELLEYGINAVLHYPFRPSELFDRLAGVSVNHQLPKEVPRMDLPPARIIVADDNPVNQRVITGQLEHLGMQVVMCANGSEALARVQEAAGELVLMDCQMPVMDGFEATRAIREWENRTQRKAIPIIAVTAHVMSGDAEQCLQAGMNAYLAKPLDVDRLQQALHHWLPRATGKLLASAPKQAEAGSREDAAPAIVNEAQLRSCLTGENAFDAELMQLAIQQLHEALDRMAVALKDGADADWRQASHRARGSCATMGFAQIAALLQVAEFEATSSAARRSILDDLRQAVPLLLNRLAALKFIMPDTTTS